MRTKYTTGRWPTSMPVQTIRQRFALRLHLIRSNVALGISTRAGRQRATPDIRRIGQSESSHPLSAICANLCYKIIAVQLTRRFYRKGVAMLTGSCLCGGIKYQIDGELGAVTNC